MIGAEGLDQAEHAVENLREGVDGYNTWEMMSTSPP